MAQYYAGDGTPCTKEENSLIDSLKRLAKRWAKDGKDLMLFSFANNSLYVCKKSCVNDDSFYDGAVESINGISHDGGDPDTI